VNSAEYRSVPIGGMPIAALSRKQWADLMVKECKSQNRNRIPRIYTSANGNVVSRYARDAAFRTLVDRMDGIDADGMPLIHISKIIRNPLPERVATTDFFHDAARAAQENGLIFYLLGGTPEENGKALERTRKLYPRLKAFGHHGYFGNHEEDVIRDILDKGTHVLWVGLGVPLEHQFAVRNAERLKGVAWIKTCGGLLNFLSGTSRRAPEWMQKSGLEWAYRVYLEPRRLLYRYLTTNVHAIYLVLRHIFGPDTRRRGPLSGAG
jgi:exopolysaccharide biosynthesis WecB/TagA/CpsF family protein